METLKINATTATAQQVRETTTSGSTGILAKFNAQARAFENSRLGWMAMMILLQTCLGSLACMHILMNNAHDIQLMICAAVTMACNSLLIAQGPAKWCLASFYLSMVANAILLIINL